MPGIITWPFRLLRACRYVLIALGAVVTGLGLWLQINGAPGALGPALTILRDLMVWTVGPEMSIFGFFSKIGGVLGLAGLLGMTLHDITRSGTERVASPEPDRATQDAPEPAYISAVQPGPTTWQDRLAAKNAASARTTAPQKPASSMLSLLRKGLVALVIGAFLVVLGATVMGYVTPAGSGTMTPGQAMIRAHLAASGGPEQSAPASDIVGTVLAALPAMPALDAETIVPWFKETLASALAGDQAAMMALGSILGGILILMLVVKIMFALGRRRAGGRASIRQMGFN